MGGCDPQAGLGPLPPTAAAADCLQAPPLAARIHTTSSQQQQQQRQQSSNRGSSSGGSNMAQQGKPASAEMQNFLVQQQAKAQLQQTISRLTDECWAKCISSPGACAAVGVDVRRALRRRAAPVAAPVPRPLAPLAAAPGCAHACPALAPAPTPRQLHVLQGAGMHGQLRPSLPRVHTVCGAPRQGRGGGRGMLGLCGGGSFRAGWGMQLRASPAPAPLPLQVKYFQSKAKQGQHSDF